MSTAPHCYSADRVQPCYGFSNAVVFTAIRGGFLLKGSWGLEIPFLKWSKRLCVYVLPIITLIRVPPVMGLLANSNRQEMYNINT